MTEQNGNNSPAHELTIEDRRKGGKNRWKRREEARAKAAMDFQQRIAELDLEALEEVVRVMKDGETDQVRLAAARDLLDRVHGKAVQRTEQDININEELDEAKRTARSRLERMLNDGTPGE